MEQEVNYTITLLGLCKGIKEASMVWEVLITLDEGKMYLSDLVTPYFIA